MRSILIVAAAAALTTPIAHAQFNAIDVRVNGERVRFTTTQPVERYGRVLVPLRDIVLPLGAALTWNPRTTVVTAAHGDTSVWLKIGSQIARVNGRQVWLDVPARTINGYTMVPLRFFSDAFGADVAWEAATRTVFIDTVNGLGSVRTAGVGSTRRFSRTAGDGAPGTGRPGSPNAMDQSGPQYSAEFGRYATDREYVQFLRDQDFRRYLNNRDRWMADHLEFRRTRAVQTVGTGTGSFEEYLLDRDFGLFGDNREVWRLNYNAFLRQRRVMNPLATNPNWANYNRDRDSLLGEMNRPLDSNSGNTRP
jgi:hypothetical protein